MLGIMFGTLCLFGLAKVVRGPHCRSFHHGHHGHHGHHEGGWRAHRGFHGGGESHEGQRRRGRGFGRAASEVFKRKLDLDDEQADLVDHAFRDLGDAGRGFKESLRTQKQDLAAAFSAEEVDESALAALFAAQDEELQRFRRTALSVFKQIHAVLEPEQRAEATRWFASQGGRWM